MIPQQQPHSHTIVLLVTAIQPKLLTALLATFLACIWILLTARAAQ